MIDLNNAKNEFEKYTSKFDLRNPKIERKVGHSFRVAEISNNIARSIKLTEEEIQIATLIGLLHDIGRFEQYTKYQTYRDADSIDHAKLGVEILENNQYLRSFIKETSYDSIIKKAIFNHNKYEIEKGLDDKTLIFCEIIRDSDKLDIFYEADEMYWEDREFVEDGISEKVLKDYLQEKAILNQDKITKIDKVLGIISFIYDIYFVKSFDIIKQNDCINKIMNKFVIKNKTVKEQFDMLRKISNNYIENRTKNMK